MVGLEPFSFCLCLLPLLAPSPFRVPMAVHGGGRVDGAPPGLPRLPCLGVCGGGLTSTQLTDGSSQLRFKRRDPSDRKAPFDLDCTQDSQVGERGNGRCLHRPLPHSPGNYTSGGWCLGGGGPPLPHCDSAVAESPGGGFDPRPCDGGRSGAVDRTALRAGGAAGRDGFEAQ